MEDSFAQAHGLRYGIGRQRYPLTQSLLNNIEPHMKVARVERKNRTDICPMKSLHFSRIEAFAIGAAVHCSLACLTNFYITSEACKQDTSVSDTVRILIRAFARLLLFATDLCRAKE